MNVNALVRETALQALVDERPLDDELGVVLEEVGRDHPAAQRARALARQGTLVDALKALRPVGIETLTVEVAACRPAAVRDALPPRLEGVGTGRAGVMLLYLSAVLLLHACLGVVGTNLVNPVLEQMTITRWVGLAEAAALLAPLLAVAFLVFGFLLVTASPESRVARLTVPSWSRARRAWAASRLALHGAAPAEAAAAVGFDTHREATASTLQEQATHLFGRAHVESLRLVDRTRFFGSLLALLVAVGLVMPVLLLGTLG